MGLCTGMVRPHGASDSSGREGIDESKASAISHPLEGQWSVETAMPLGSGERVTGARGQQGLSPPPATHGAPGEARPHSAGC